MGIGIVIAILQIKDFFGITYPTPEGFFGIISSLFNYAHTAKWSDALVGFVTLITLILWPKITNKIPGHLPAVVLGTIVAIILTKYFGQDVATIGTKFTYTLADGTVGNGIPPVLPSFVFPWDLPGPGGKELVWNFETIQSIIVAAFSMAILGAIESLLCAVVLDGMTNTRHHSNGELFGQGLGNIIAPFVGGITSTAAIARSAANVKAGGSSPVAAVVHALLVLISILFLAPILSELPLAAMSALLLMVAYNMSEWRKVVKLTKTAPRADVMIMFCCIFATVIFDMVVAISFGIIMASIIFMRDMAKMTKVQDLTSRRSLVEGLNEEFDAYRINGPLFFASAERTFRKIRHEVEGAKGVILQFDAVNMLDAGGYHCFSQFCNDMTKRNTKLIIAELNYQPLRVLVKSKFAESHPEILFTKSLEEAIKQSNTPLDNDLTKSEQ
jgi:SulP family sulfate permease